MSKMESKCGIRCANCDKSFENTLDEPQSLNDSKENDDNGNELKSNQVQVTEFLVSFADCERIVTLFEALNSVFTLSTNLYCNENEFVWNSNVVICCSKCAGVICTLYKSYVELMELSKASGILAKSLKQAHLWHVRRGEYEEDEGVVSGKQYNNAALNFETSLANVETEAQVPYEVNKVEVSDDYYDEFDNTRVNSILSVEFREGQHSPEVNPGPEPDVKKKIVQEDLIEDTPSGMSTTKTTNLMKSSSLSQSLDYDGVRVSRSSKRKRIFGISNLIFEARAKGDKKKKKKAHGKIRYNPSKRNIKARKTVKSISRTLAPKHAETAAVEEPRPDELFSSVVSPRPHRRVPYIPPKIPCQHCNNVFHWNWMAEQHVLLVHDKKKPKECLECGLTYFNPEVLKSHICIPKAVQEVEKEFKPFRCSYCGKMLINKGNYTRHCSAHDSDQIFSCPYPDCKLTFKIAENLVRHKRVHERAPPSWQCSTCGKLFKIKRRLIEHLDIHSQEKKYLCNHCGARFSQHKALVRHTSIHEKILRYKCPICFKGFKRRDNVTQHLNSKVHPKELVADIRSKGITAVDTSTCPIFSGNTSDIVQEMISQDNQSTPEIPKNMEIFVSTSNGIGKTGINHSNQYSSRSNVLQIQHPVELQYSDLLHL